MRIDAGKATDYYLPGLPKGYDKIYWAVRGISEDEDIVWSESRPLSFGNDEETGLPVWNLTAIPYPNPVSGSGLRLLIDTREKGEMPVRIFAVDGSLVYETVFVHPEEGPQSYELPEMNLARGLYVMEVSIKNERAVKKLTVF